MELKQLQDYYDQVKERFPDLEMWEIDKILKHGMRSFYMVNVYGADVLLKHKSFTMYFGKLFRNNLIFYKYWRLKHKIKLRIKWKRDKRRWDGYYYFGLTEEDYQSYFKNKKGRIKKKVNIQKLYGYKIPEECFLDQKFKYFFKFKHEDVGFTLYYDEYLTRNVEYIGYRDKNKQIILNEKK